jgi:hypothetical protein
LIAKTAGRLPIENLRRVTYRFSSSPIEVADHDPARIEIEVSFAGL